MDEELKAAWQKIRDWDKTIKELQDSLKEARLGKRTAEENFAVLMADEAAGQQRMFRREGNAAATA